MRILVTGGAGFIGSHVADRYRSAGHEVAVLDDLSTGRRENVSEGVRLYVADIATLEGAAAVADFRPDVLNHHAAQMSVPISVDDPALDARVNLVGLLTLMEACRKVGTRKVVFASSGGTVYGEPEKLPVDETAPPLPTNPYGISKHTSEHYLSYYSRQHGIRFTALRYSNVYGPRQLPHGEAGVVAIFFQKFLRGETPTIFGDGKYIRDYVFVEDVADANLRALDRAEDEAVNVGTGVPTDTNQLFEACARVAGWTRGATHGPERRGDLRANYLVVERAARTLGWKPSVALEAGLRRTYEFFRGPLPR